MHGLCYRTLVFSAFETSTRAGLDVHKECNMLDRNAVYTSCK